MDVDEFMHAIHVLSNVPMQRDDALAVFAVADDNGDCTISQAEFIEHYVLNYLR